MPGTTLVGPRLTRQLPGTYFLSVYYFIIHVFSYIVCNTKYFLLNILILNDKITFGVFFIILLIHAHIYDF